jgi:hypothetical protein
MSPYEIKSLEKKGRHSIFSTNELDSDGNMLWPAIDIEAEAQRQ